MIYALVDVSRKRVVDVFPIAGEDSNDSGENKTKILTEIGRIYFDLTGSERNFQSLSYAKSTLRKVLETNAFETVQLAAPKVEPQVAKTNGPVAIARRICGEGKKAGWSRKQVIEACAQAGVKRSTASVQYQKNKTATLAKNTVVTH